MEVEQLDKRLKSIETRSLGSKRMDGWSLQFDGGIRHVGRLRVPDITKLKDFFF